MEKSCLAFLLLLISSIALSQDKTGELIDNEVYFIAHADGQRATWRMKPDGSDLTRFVVNPVYDELNLDTITRLNYYWHNNALVRMPLAGNPSHDQEVVFVPDSNFSPLSISVDSVGERVFWNRWEKLHVVNFDGSNHHVLNEVENPGYSAFWKLKFNPFDRHLYYIHNGDVATFNWIWTISPTGYVDSLMLIYPSSITDFAFFADHSLTIDHYNSNMWDVETEASTPLDFSPNAGILMTSDPDNGLVFALNELRGSIHSLKPDGSDAKQLVEIYQPIDIAVLRSRDTFEWIQSAWPQTTVEGEPTGVLITDLVAELNHLASPL